MVRPADSIPKADPLIEEVRATKQAISARYDHDVRRMCDDLRRRQSANANRLVRRRNSAAPRRG
jgi:hypothetical protein